MQIQRVLGSDIAMVLRSVPARRRRPRESTRSRSRGPPRGRRAAAPRRARRARRCSASSRAASTPRAALRHMAEITALDFDGHALGGLAVGETVDDTYRVLDEVAHPLPAERPRYLMGVGTPARPRARHRRRHRHVRLRDADPQRAQRLPVHAGRAGEHPERRQPDRSRARSTRSARARPAAPTRARTCDISTIAKEILYARLATLHNLTFYARHVRRLRDRILAEGPRA